MSGGLSAGLAFGSIVRDASAQTNSNIVNCGELHPTYAESERIKQTLLDQGELATESAQELAVLRVHPEWGRWGQDRVLNKPLRVAFMDDGHPMNEIVVEAANEWHDHMRLRFEFVGTYKGINNPGNLDILVKQDSTGNNSYLGVASRYFAQQGIPTLRLQRFDWTVPTRRRIGIALHELGHALGIIHEHQNPDARLNFNEEEVYRYYEDTQGWDRETTQSNVLSQYQLGATHRLDLRTDFDEDSIMMYALPGSLFADGSSGFTKNQSLSFLDTFAISRVY